MPVDPPDVLLTAYDLLLERRTVEIVRPLQIASNVNEGSWEFAIQISLNQNPSGLPGQVILRAAIDEGFPLTSVDFYPETQEPSGFQHQDAETGKLCLPDENLAPYDERRLYTYVDWAREWLNDAANDTLAKQGEPYELPDFSRKLLQKDLPTKLTTHFVETTHTLAAWTNRIGQTGEVDLVVARKVAIFAAKYRFGDVSVHQPLFGTFVQQATQKLVGRWILLPDIRAHRHRPAQTFAELKAICEASGVSLFEEMKKAWTSATGSEVGAIVLIGFPIPAVFGGPNTEIHWQPLHLNAPNAGKKIQTKGFRPIDSGSGAHWKRLLAGGEFNGADQLPWGKSANVSEDRLYARGAMSSQLRSNRVAIVGCGALGSAVAEMLARGGVGVQPKSLKLYDPQRFDIENACRHTLDGTDIQLTKAVALAHRLSSACPLSLISGSTASAPIGNKQIFSDIDLVIDCTADEPAFLALDAKARTTGVRLISLFMDFRAELLTLVASGEDRSAGIVLSDLYSAVRSGLPGVDAKKYFAPPEKTELILPGIGCWYPTFPAALSSIWLLASAAVDLISRRIAIQGKAYAAMLKRNAQASEDKKPVLEILWESPLA